MTVLTAADCSRPLTRQLSSNTTHTLQARHSGKDPSEAQRHTLNSRCHKSPEVHLIQHCLESTILEVYVTPTGTPRARPPSFSPAQVQQTLGHPFHPGTKTPKFSDEELLKQLITRFRGAPFGLMSENKGEQPGLWNSLAGSDYR